MFEFFFAWACAFGAGTPSRDVGEHVLWTGPAGCPTQERVRERVRELVDPAADVPPIELRATVDSVPDAEGRLRLDVEITGAAPRLRTFWSTRCSELADTAVVVAAVALDPFGAATQSIPETSEEASEQPSEETSDLGQPRALSTPLHDEPMGDSNGSWSLAAAVGPSWASQPLPFAAIRVYAAHQRHSWAVRFGIGGWLPQRVDVSRAPPPSPARIRLARLSAQLEGCALPGRGSVRAPLCLGLTGGGMVAIGDHAAEPASRWTTSVTGSAGVLWRPRRRVGGFAALEGGVELTRPQDDGMPSAFVGSRLSLTAVLGLEIRWPPQ